MGLGHRPSERCCHDLHVHYTPPPPFPLARVVLPTQRPVAHRLNLLRQDDAAALRALIAARSGAGQTSEFAGMALIQAILPTLVTIANRDHQACLDDYIGEAWVVIVTFPLSRTNKVCTNVALDCLHAISSRRQHSSPETPAESIDISAPEMQEPGQVASDLLSAAEELGIITPTSAPVLRSVWVEALDCTTAAQRHNTSPTGCELDALGRAGP